MEDAEILFEERGSIGIITLNRPKALNSLTASMCRQVRERLQAWTKMPSVRAVVVQGAGEKAFCAGGDVVKVTRSYKAGTDEWREFFTQEYLMNVAIAEFPKPYISLVDGIVMGGGVGISWPGDFWVASEKTLFAMPETGLGLFPDVGGGFLLPRLPGQVGMYLALTGARLKVDDLYAVGIATHTVSGDQLPKLVDALANADLDDKGDIKSILDGFHSDPEPAPLAEVMDDIDRCFDGVSVEDIMQRLITDGTPWAEKQNAILKSKSPMSLKLTFAQMQQGLAQDRFRDEMMVEFRLVTRIMREDDFFEGVRAILLDKDNNPAWSPARLEDISDEHIGAFFAPLGNDELPLYKLDDV